MADIVLGEEKGMCHAKYFEGKLSVARMRQLVAAFGADIKWDDLEDYFRFLSHILQSAPHDRLDMHPHLPCKLLVSVEVHHEP